MSPVITAPFLFFKHNNNSMNPEFLAEDTIICTSQSEIADTNAYQTNISQYNVKNNTPENEAPESITEANDLCSSNFNQQDDSLMSKALDDKTALLSDKISMLQTKIAEQDSLEKTLDEKLQAQNDELEIIYEKLKKLDVKQDEINTMKKFLEEQKLDAEKDSTEQRKMFVERFTQIDSDFGLTTSESEFRNYLANNPDKFDYEKFKKYCGTDSELNINEFIAMYKNLSLEPTQPACAEEKILAETKPEPTPANEPPKTSRDLVVTTPQADEVVTTPAEESEQDDDMIYIYHFDSNQNHYNKTERQQNNNVQREKKKKSSYNFSWLPFLLKKIITRH